MAYIFNAPGVAQDAMGRASSLINQAQAQAQSIIDIPQVKVNFSSADISFDDVSAPPAFEGSFVEPVFDETIELRDIVIPENIVLPTAPSPFDASSLFNASMPTFNVSETGLDAPSLSTPALPSSPSINMPSYSGDSGNSLTAPSITAPTFDESFDGTDPGTVDDQDVVGDYRALSPEISANMEAFADSMLSKWCPEYNAAMATLEEKISQAMNGNTAIDDAVELQIWERARSRAVGEKYGLEKQATEILSRRGHSIPPGSLQAALDQAHAAYSKAVSFAASETAIERAKIELNHLQFVMGITSDMRKAMVQAVLQAQSNAIQSMGIALELARSAADIAIRVHNANVEVFRAKLDFWRAKGEIFKIRLEAAFADLEIFKAQVEAEKLKAEVDRNLIEVYTAKIAAEETKVRMYVAQLEGVRQIAELERNKIALFEAKVRAYVARVQGKEAEFGAYQAAIQGDLAKVEVYGKQVEAYRGQIEAVKAVNESNKVNADITSAYNKNLVELFDSNVRKYIAQLEASGKVFESKREAYVAALELYKVDIQRSMQKADIELKNNQQKMELALKQADVSTEINVSAARLKESANETAAQMAMHGAAAYGSMASSAFGVVNLSYSESLQL